MYGLTAACLIRLTCAAQVAEGLAAIHARGMAHGFFSAEKVLLTAAPRAPHGFRAFVADYGLAPPAGAPPLTQVRRGRGTPQ